MINVEGRQQLIDALHKWHAHYDQGTFGRISQLSICTDNNECGTVMCMAGIALILKIGWDEYLLKMERKTRCSLDDYTSIEFNRECLQAGKELLGLPNHSIAYREEVPEIFDEPQSWPANLWNSYRQALIGFKVDRKAMVEVAVSALMAMDEVGQLPR